MARVTFTSAAIPTPSNSITVPLRGAIKLQDIVPSADQFSSGVNGYEEGQPFAEWAVDAYNTLGLRFAKDAPNDPARGWYSTVNMDVAGQLTVPMIYAGDALPVLAGAFSLGSFYGLVNAFDGTGFLSFKSAGAEYHYLRWNGATYPGTFTDVTRINGQPLALMALSAFAAQRRNTYDWAMRPVWKQNGGSIWVALQSGGLVDLKQVYPQTVAGTAKYWATAVLGDVLLAFRQTDGTGVSPGITIEAYRPYSPTLTAVLSSGAAVTVAIDNEICMSPPINHEGKVYIATDRNLYEIMWDDDKKRVLTNLIREESRITSNLVEWNGNLYYGAGNQVNIYSTTRSTVPPVQIDPNYGLKPPFNGDICWLGSRPDGLYCLTTPQNLGGTGASGMAQVVDVNLSAMMYKLLPNLAWHSHRFLYDYLSVITGYIGTNLTPNYGPPMLLTDTTGLTRWGSYFGLPTSDLSNMRLIPVGSGSTQNPEFSPAFLRQQEYANRFYLFPRVDGRNAILPKKAERIEARLAGITNTNPLLLWYSKNNDPYSPDTFNIENGPEMIGTGAWTIGAYISPNTSPDLSVIGGQGNGITVVPFSTPVDFQTIQWAVQLIGDPTGSTLPRFFGMKMRFLELPSKFYVWQIPVQLVVGTNKTADIDTPQNPAELMAIHTILESLANLRPRPLVTVTFPHGVQRTGLFSKFEQSLEQFTEYADSDPVPDRAALTKTLYTISFEEILPAESNIPTLG